MHERALLARWFEPLYDTAEHSNGEEMFHIV